MSSPDMQKPQSAYCTLEQVQAQLLKADPGASFQPAADLYADFVNYITPVIPQISNLITLWTSRSFVPYKASVAYYFYDLLLDNRFRRYKLYLEDELLVVSDIIWNDVLLSPLYYRLLCSAPPAADEILFSNMANLYFDTTNTIDNGILITGTWGYHPYIPQMYTAVESGVTIADDTTTTIEVANANAYQTLQYIRCDSELMQITARTVNDAPASDTLTVLRGVNGTLALPHIDQRLDKYNVPVVIALAATRMAAYLYQKRLDVGGAVQVGDGSVFLDALPMVVKEVIAMQRAPHYEPI